MSLDVKKLQGLLKKHGEDVFVDEFTKMLGIKEEGADRFIESASKKADNISFVQLAEVCCGWEGASALRAGEKASTVQRLAESAGLSYTAFPKLAGQAVQQKVIESYNAEEFVLRGMINAEAQNFSGKGFTTDLDSLSEAESVGENQSYPWSQFGENQIAIPASVKWGNIIGLTRETLVGDRTGEIMRRAAQAGRSIGIAVENEIARVFLGVTNTYERNGVQQDTYDTDNSKNDFVINSWRDFDALDELFNVMVDPVSGEALEMPTRNVLASFVTVMREARHLLNATRTDYDQNLADGNNSQTAVGGNPLADLGQVMMSTRLYNIATKAAPDGLGLTPAQARTLIIYGSLRDAFVRKVVWPLETEEIRDSSWSQDKDVIVAWKSSERSVTMVERRHVVIKAWDNSAT